MTKETTKTAKVSTRKSRPTKKVVSPELEMEDMQNDVYEEVSVMPASSTKRRYLFSFLALLIILGVAAYKYQYLIIPAKVNGKPVYMWEYLSYLHTTYGKDAMSSLTTKSLIDQEITKSKVKVTQSDIDTEVASIDKQASASGGVKALLSVQQMTMAQFRDQVRIQLAVKQILKDKLVVATTSIDDAYTKNKDSFKGVSQDVAKAQIKTQLENQQFQSVAGQWLNDLRTSAKIQFLLPGTAPAPTN